MEERNSKVITIACGKGGVGKSTTCINLAMFLAKLNPNKKVCVIDGDPSGNATLNFINTRDYGNDIKEFCDLVEQYDPNNNNTLHPLDVVLTSTHLDNLWFIPTLIDSRLANVQSILMSKEYIIQDILAILKQEFDYIIIDTAPNSSVFERKILRNSDIVIPVTTGLIYSAEGFTKLFDILKEIKSREKLNISIPAIVFNLYVERQTLDNQTLETLLDIEKNMGIKLYTLPRSQDVNNYYSKGIPPFNTKIEAFQKIEELAIDLSKEN